MKQLIVIYLVPPARKQHYLVRSTIAVKYRKNDGQGCGLVYGVLVGFHVSHNISVK